MTYIEPSPTPPATFDPVDSKNGTPGDATALAALGKRYADTASEIASQVTQLKKLAGESANFWKGAAAGTFTDKANDLAGRIDAAQGRYEAAANAVNGFAGELATLQESAYWCVTQAQAAQQTMHENDPSTAPTPSNPPTDAETAAAKTRTTSYGAAKTTLGQMQSQYDDAVSLYKKRASHYAGVLSDGLDDGLKDGFWDRHFHFLQELAKWVGVVILVVVVVALIVATAGLGGVVLLGGITLADALVATAAALTAVQLAIHLTLYETGHGSLTDVIIDAISLATFGLGPALGVAARYGAEGAEGVASTVSAARAGRAAFGGGPLGNVLYRLSTDSPAMRELVTSFGKGAAAFGRADAASADAAAAIRSLKADSTAMQRLMAFGEDRIADPLAKIAALNDAVPGTLRLNGLEGIAHALQLTNGTVNSGVLTVGINAAIKTFTQGDEPVLEPDVQAEIDDIASTWSQPFAHLGS